MSQVYTKTGDKAQDEKLLLPFTYIQQVPGKQIRTKLALAFNYWLKISEDKLRSVGEIVQMLHNSSLLSLQTDVDTFPCGDVAINCLKYYKIKTMPDARKSKMKEKIEILYCAISNESLKKIDANCLEAVRKVGIDDIQDNSILRRGIPVAHSIYGVASTINAANYIIIAALERTLELGHPDATTVYTEQLLELHRGQGMEIYWRDNFQCPSEEEYKEMTIKKTGGLFMLAIRLMQLFSDNKSDFTKLTAILGLYFQIRDDYCNLCLQEYAENKSYCEDLTEGKFSFPIIHAIKTQAADKQVLHILRQRTRDIEVKRYCISLLERLGSFRHTRATLQQLDSDARAELERLGGNPLLAAVLDDLLSWRREKDFQNDIDFANSV